MEQRLRTQRLESGLNRARSFAWTANTQCEYAEAGTEIAAKVNFAACWIFVCSGRGRLKHGQNARVIQITGRDSFEMRADAAQFGSDKAINKMQTPVEPGKKLVLDLVVNSECDLSAVGTDLSKVDNAHKGDIPSHGLERILLRRVAVDRQEDRVRLKTEWAAEAEIHRLGRCHSCTRHHQKLTAV